MTTRLFSFLALCGLLASGPASSAWIPTGVPVIQPENEAGDAWATPDGHGGWFIAWEDVRHPSVSSDDVYLQHLTPAGTVAPGWPLDGLPICALQSTAYPEGITPDGAGGVLVAWLDYRANGHIYVQRVRADGSLFPGWPINGVPVSLAPQYQSVFSLVSDGASGAFFAWEDTRDLTVTGQLDIYAQHVTGGGTTAPGWPADGLAVCVFPSPKGMGGVAPDGSGGVFVTWTDLRTGTRTIFAQHLLSDGSVAPGWAANGISESPGRALS